MKILAAIALAGLVLTSAAWAEAPRELGHVSWQRDLDSALAQSRDDGRPLFVLFQEVPGCATCVNFGDQALSNPLMVEAIETEFRPVAILNNRGGKDAEVLRRYAEPAWNNPVVRFLDPGGKDLIPRKSAVFSEREVAERMIAALLQAKRPVPGYLKIAAEEAGAVFPRRATFGMHCYWSGEACLGEQPGVISSRAGWLDGREVVEVQFDGKRLPYRELVKTAHERGCADHVFAHGPDQYAAASELFGPEVTQSAASARPAKASDQKYFLRKSRLRDLDLTPLQSSRVNTALQRGEDPRGWLSPGQLQAAAALPR